MRIKSAAVALTLVGASTLGVVTTTAGPALAASCPDNGWSIKDGRIGKYFASTYTNIRTGPSTACTAVGQGQTSHQVQLDCWKFGENGTWSHLYDFTTGKQGWVKDSLLVGNGADVQC